MNENYKVLGSYNTIWIGAGSMTPLSTNGAEAGVHEFATNDIMMDYLAFDATTEEFAAFSFVMPENWSLGTIKFKAYWLGASGCSAADTVEWELQAGALSNDDAVDAALGTAQVISDAITADGDLQITGASPAITIGGTPAAETFVRTYLNFYPAVKTVSIVSWPWRPLSILMTTLALSGAYTSYCQGMASSSSQSHT